MIPFRMEPRSARMPTSGDKCYRWGTPWDRAPRRPATRTRAAAFPRAPVRRPSPDGLLNAPSPSECAPGRTAREGTRAIGAATPPRRSTPGAGPHTHRASIPRGFGGPAGPEARRRRSSGSGREPSAHPARAPPDGKAWLRTACRRWERAGRRIRRWRRSGRGSAAPRAARSAGRAGGPRNPGRQDGVDRGIAFEWRDQRRELAERRREVGIPEPDEIRLRVERLEHAPAHRFGLAEVDRLLADAEPVRIAGHEGPQQRDGGIGAAVIHEQQLK